jgi:aminomethyltransferase
MKSQWTGGIERVRVGLKGLDKTPVREGTVLVDGQGQILGTVTSGTVGPTVNQPIAMAYVPLAASAPGTPVWAEVRGKRIAMHVSAMPFVPNRYFRG